LPPRAARLLHCEPPLRPAKEPRNTPPRDLRTRALRAAQREERVHQAPTAPWPHTSLVQRQPRTPALRPWLRSTAPSSPRRCSRPTVPQHRSSCPARFSKTSNPLAENPRRQQGPARSPCASKISWPPPPPPRRRNPAPRPLPASPTPTPRPTPPTRPTLHTPRAPHPRTPSPQAATRPPPAATAHRPRHARPDGPSRGSPPLSSRPAPRLTR
ncbi:hypothetical protein T484DRAFT_1658660, partial [Baffinella frigidus]